MQDRSTVYRLALETSLGARTIGKVLAGEHVRPATLRAVQLAARKLHIALPCTEGNAPETA